MRKKRISWLLVIAMVLSMLISAPITASAAALPGAVFSDGDIDRVYFSGDTLTFNLSGLPVGTPPAGIPAGTSLRVSLGIVDASNTFTDFTLFNTSTLTSEDPNYVFNGMGDNTGWYLSRTLNADGTISSDVSGTIVTTPPPTLGVAAVKIYVYTGSAWQNFMDDGNPTTPDFIPLTADGKNAIVGLDGILEMPDGVTSDPVIGTLAQTAEDLRSLDISFTKTIATDKTGTFVFTGLNLLDNSSELAGLEDGLIMNKVSIPAAGSIAQYILGVDVEALTFLNAVGATVSVTSASFDGYETSDFEAVATEVTGGLVSGLSFDDSTDTVSFTVNHFSNYTLSILENEQELYDAVINVVDGTGTGVGWTYASGEVWINEDGLYLISGDGIQTSNRIRVKTGVTASVTLDNVNINVNLPFECGDNSNVTLILADDSINTFMSYGGHAGLRVKPTAKLTISTAGQSLGNGSLSAYGGADSSSSWASAGIGGSELESSGTIIINGGTIFAKGGNGRTPGAWRGPGAAGIGGAQGRACGDITINGGTVTAIGGDVNPEGAGIGGGSSDSSTYGGKITISGGTVRAYSGQTGTSGTGIGFCSTIAIADTADVKAYSSGNYPAVYGTTDTSGHSAFLLNLMLDAAVSQDTNITITQIDDSTNTFEMTLPANYKNFAATVETTDNYNARLSDGSKKIVSITDENDDFPGIWELPERSVSSVSVKLIQIPFTVNVDSLSGGSITASKNIAEAFETISLTITPDEGKRLLAGTLKYNDGTADHVITGTSFIMPAANVIIKAEFEDTAYWSEGIESADQYSYGGGDGSSVEQAYEIATPLQMAQLAYNVNSGNSYANKYLILTSNIDLSGKQWMPIGKSYAFEGHFDGGGYSVSGMVMTEVSGADYYGLFGNLGMNGTIKNLTIESGSISFSETAGYGYFGGIVGHSLGLVKDCVNKADISIINDEWTYAGGIVGLGNSDTRSYTWSARISGCRNEGDIQIGRLGSVGGIIGSQSNSTAATYIDQCSNYGSVTGGQYAEAGGIAGRIGNASTIGIINCFNTGSVTSGDGTSNSVYAGGIVGYEYYSQVKNCYNTGSVTILYSSLGNTFCGGISGHADIAAVNCYNVGNVTGTGRAGEGINGAGIPSENCYYLDTSTPSTAISGITALTDAQMKNQASYEGWGFPDIWSINRTDNNGYPALAWQGFVHETTSNDATLSGLSASGITLSPAFDSATTDYTANVSNSISSTTVSAVTSYDYATVTINGAKVSSKTISLNVGSNTITVVVTAENGTTTKIYTIDINRAASAGGGGGGTPAVTGTEITVSTSDGSASVKGTLTETEDGTKIIIKNDAFNELDDANQPVSISAQLATVKFDKKAMDAIGASSDTGDVTLTIRKVTSSELSDRDRALVGLRPVYDLTVKKGGKTISDFKGGHATVTIPYTLKTGENPNAVVIYYLSEDGKLIAVRGHYDADLKAVVFKTTHFSKFVIVYNPVSFNDVAADAWYKNAVDFIAARDITSGTGNNMFGPEVKLTRAQFVVLLMNAYQINTKNQGESSQIQNFSDAGNTYYTDYLLAAKALGIVNGIGNNMFAPEKEITRQEMFVMLFNALKVIDEVPAYVNNTPLSSFNDADKIASWANEALSSLVKTGTVGGYNNSLYPTATTTRAEIAQVLYNLLSK